MICESELSLKLLNCIHTVKVAHRSACDKMYNICSYGTNLVMISIIIAQGGQYMLSEKKKIVIRHSLCCFSTNPTVLREKKVNNLMEPSGSLPKY